MSGRITININLAGKPFGIRYWPAVPRVGEVIVLHDPKRERGNLYPANVKSVIWGLFHDDKPHGGLECEIEVEWRQTALSPTTSKGGSRDEQ